MSIEDFGNPKSGCVEFIETPLDNCFWCHNPLPPIVVFWHGTSDIAFHRQCATDFAVHLIHDAEKLRSIERGRPIDIGVHLETR